MFFFLAPLPPRRKETKEKEKERSKDKKKKKKKGRSKDKKKSKSKVRGPVDIFNGTRHSISPLRGIQIYR